MQVNDIVVEDTQFECIIGEPPGEWGNLPQQMPDIADDMNQLAAKKEDWESHIGRQVRESEDWKIGHIGMLPEENIFYDGISPIDFVRAFHDKHKDLETIDGLLDIDGGDPYFATMGLHKDHIYQNFTEDELDGLCYERVGSLRWYGERIAYKVGCELDEIPLVVLQAIQQVNIEKSLGRNNFRNFMRGVNKKRKKLGAKHLQDIDGSYGFSKYKSTNKKPELPTYIKGKVKEGKILLTWD